MKNYSCIFTGGSSRGLCYIGVLKALEEKNIKIKHYIGSSIGALFITFYALGYSVAELEEETDKLDLSTLFLDFNFNILSDFAFSKGNIYLTWLREKIEKKFYGDRYIKGKMNPVTFKDLDKNLYIIATDFENSEPFVFSKEITPDVEIALALRASSSMPALLPPFKFENKKLIDGDILRGYPITKSLSFLEIKKDELIEFRITGGRKNNFSKNPVKLVNSIVNIAAYAIDNWAYETYRSDYNIIQLDVGGVSFTDFKLSQNKKKQIYDIGYETTINELVKSK